MLLDIRGQENKQRSLGVPVFESQWQIDVILLSITNYGNASRKCGLNRLYVNS